MPLLRGDGETGTVGEATLEERILKYFWKEGLAESSWRRVANGWTGSVEEIYSLRRKKGERDD